MFLVKPSFQAQHLLCTFYLHEQCAWTSILLAPERALYAMVTTNALNCQWHQNLVAPQATSTQLRLAPPCPPSSPSPPVTSPSPSPPALPTQSFSPSHSAQARWVAVKLDLSLFSLQPTWLPRFAQPPHPSPPLLCAQVFPHLIILFGTILFEMMLGLNHFLFFVFQTP